MSSTIISLPTDVDDVSVDIASAVLRRIDFSALDFNTSRRLALEYIKTYYPNDFNDFVASNGYIILMSIISTICGRLSLRQDILAQDGFLPTAKSPEAVDNHLALINERIRRQTPAYADFEVTLDSPVLSDILIPAGSKVTATGQDAKQIVYELYASPGDFTSNIVVPSGKRGIIAHGLEGQFGTPQRFTSQGGSNQEFSFVDRDLLESPMFVTVDSGSGVVENWLVVVDPIEKYGPNAKVTELTIAGNRITFRFGDNVTGRALVAGQVVNIAYRVGGGVRGRVGAGQLKQVLQVTPQPPANAPVTVNVRNVVPSSGGTDRETIDQAKRRAPRSFSTQRSIVSGADYMNAAAGFSHPVFGTIIKAIAAIKTDRNANLVILYCVALGVDGQPSGLSAGLKTALQTHFSLINVLTDHLEVADAVLRPVNIDMTVVVNNGFDATSVKTNVESAIDHFFSIDNWEIGEPLYVSNIVETVESIDGVKYVDVFSPSDNILPNNGSIADGIDFNELVVAGSRTVRYCYDRVK